MKYNFSARAAGTRSSNEKNVTVTPASNLFISTPSFATVDPAIAIYPALIQAIYAKGVDTFYYRIVSYNTGDAKTLKRSGRPLLYNCSGGCLLANAFGVSAAVTSGLARNSCLSG